MRSKKDPTLFDAPRPIDPTVSSADRPRLKGQNAQILELLRQGPQTNVALAGVSLKYTSRISDIRAAGFDVECSRRAGGLTTYKLKGWPR